MVCCAISPLYTFTWNDRICIVQVRQLGWKNLFAVLNSEWFRSNFIHCVLMGLWKTEIVFLEGIVPPNHFIFKFSKLSCSVIQGQEPRSELVAAGERETAPASYGQPVLPEHPVPPETRMVNGARFWKQQIFCLAVCSCLKCFVNSVFHSNNSAYVRPDLHKVPRLRKVCLLHARYFLLHALYFRMGDPMSKNREYSFDNFQCIAATLDCN